MKHLRTINKQCRFGLYFGLLFLGRHLVAEEPAVAAFKSHFASTPCFSRIVYSEVSCGNTPVRTLHAGYCGDSFFVRQLTGSEDIDHPISSSNQNRSPLYVGRLGDTRWQIAGYQMSLSLLPNLKEPDNYTRMSDGMQIMVGGVVCFGSQHVQPGSFVWSGNRFKAQASALAKGFGFQEFEGQIIVSNGLVTKMVIEGSGAWAYSYDENTNVPFGLPTEFVKCGENDSCLEKCIIREMIRGNPSQQMSNFDPKSHIAQEITIRNVFSNSVQIVKPTENAIVTEMFRKEDEALMKKNRPHRPAGRVLALTGMLLISASFAVLVIMQRKRARSGK